MTRSLESAVRMSDSYMFRSCPREPFSHRTASQERHSIAPNRLLEVAFSHSHILDTGRKLTAGVLD